MNKGKPEGGKWNYDEINRKSISNQVNIPPPLDFSADDITKEVLELTETLFGNHFGVLNPFGYSHHIQRLMVLSNFSNLTETDPRLLNKWFRTVYVDAYEWVVLSNVLGMSTFADGGTLVSKPYVSSGNYIHKMSNYCGNCRYNVKEKLGENACPFNYLYWNFIGNQQEKFKKNPRMGFMIKQYQKKRPGRKRIDSSRS